MIADRIAAYIPSDSAIILDYGCGEALHADHGRRCGSKINSGRSGAERARQACGPIWE